MPRHKEFDQAEALAHAMDTFWLRGFEGASIGELEEQMRIGRGSIYLAFGDKHSLFMAALEAYCDTFVQEFADAFAEDVSTRDALRLLFQRRLEGLRSEGECKGCFLTNSIVELAPNDDAVAAVTSRTLSRIEEIIYSSLERDRRAGRLPKGKKPRTLALFIVNNILGLTVVAKAGREVSDLHEIAQVLLEALPMD